MPSISNKKKNIIKHEDKSKQMKTFYSFTNINNSNSQKAN